MRRGLQRRASSGSPDGLHVASGENLRAGCIQFQPVYRGDVGILPSSSTAIPRSCRTDAHSGSGDGTDAGKSSLQGRESGLLTASTFCGYTDQSLAPSNTGA